MKHVGIPDTWNRSPPIQKRSSEVIFRLRWSLDVGTRSERSLLEGRLFEACARTFDSRGCMIHILWDSCQSSQHINACNAA